MAGIGGNSRGSSSGAIVGTVAGFAAGVVAGLFGPRLMRHQAAAPPKHTVTRAAALPAGAATVVQLTAQPSQRGLLLSSSVPVQLSPTAHGKMARQQGQSVFTGFRNWNVTSGYLSNGVGSFTVRGSNGAPLSTGWSGPSYRQFVSGQPLQVRVPTGQTCTLLFQHRGHAPVELATFTVGAAKAS